MDGASFKEMRRLVDDLDASTQKLKDQDGLKAAPKVMQEMHQLSVSMQKTKPWAIGTALFFALLGGGLTGAIGGFLWIKSGQIDMSGYGINIMKSDEMTKIYIPKQFEIMEENGWQVIHLNNPGFLQPQE